MTHHVTEIKTRGDDGILYYFITVGISFLVLFASSSIVFGLFRAAKISDFLGGFYDGVNFGFLLSIILIGLVTMADLFERFRSFIKYRQISYRSRQERLFLIKDHYNIFFDRLIVACKRCNFHSKTQKEKDGIIKATTNRSWKSFGEKIEIHLRKNTDGTLLLKISSEPVLFATVLDFSKNFNNIEALLSCI